MSLAPRRALEVHIRDALEIHKGTRTHLAYPISVHSQLYGEPSHLRIEVQSIAHKLHVFRGANAILHCGEHPMSIDDEARADHAHFLHPVHVFLAPSAVRLHDGMVLICGHRKRKIFFFHEFLHLLNRVGGNAENTRTIRSEFFGMISKIACLTCAQRGSGGRVEPDDGTVAGKVSERDSTTTSEREGEVGGLSPGASLMFMLVSLVGLDTLDRTYIRGREYKTPPPARQARRRRGTAHGKPMRSSAESKGFEPLVQGCCTAVFKTATFGRSVNSPCAACEAPVHPTRRAIGLEKTSEGQQREGGAALVLRRGRQC